MKQLLTRSLAAMACTAITLVAGAAQAASVADCEKQAADKKLAGAAKNSFVKKCSEGAAAQPSAAEVCEKQAAEKKLAGAAKNSFMKKCETDATAKK